LRILPTLDAIFSKFGARLEGANSRKMRENAWEGIADLLMHPVLTAPPGATGIVFSKDRALQLHAFLESWFACVLSPCPLRVLFATGDPAHEASYAELMEIWGGRVVFVRESSFRDDLIAILQGSDEARVLFFTDDGIFLDPFDLDDAVRWDPRSNVFALTKGKGLRHCFLTDRPQALPVFETPPDGAEEFLCWRWKDAEVGDWSYPLSLDGHVLGRQELSILMDAIPFRSPNTLEAALQVYVPLFLPRRGLSYPREKLVNIPVNTVQRDWRNRDTGLHSASELLAKWNEGLRIEHEAFRGLSSRDAETSSYRFVKRA